MPAEAQPMWTRWLSVAIAVLVAAGLAAWLLTSTGRPDAAGPTGPAEPRPAPTPGLAAMPKALKPVAPPESAPSASSAKAQGRPVGIEGVVRRDGRPAAARVELRRERSGSDTLFESAARLLADDALASPVQAVDAGDDGRFAFDGLSDESFVVRAEARDGTVGRARAWTGAPDARRVVEVALQTTTSLGGRVVHANGTPWLGDVLVVGSIGGAEYADWCLGATRTDAEGRFAISQLSAGDAAVIAVAASGSHVIGKTVVLPTPDDYLLVWEGDRVPVAGRVAAAADGAPVRGARVTAGEANKIEFVDLAETGDDGRFRVLVPPSGGTITASASGFTSKNATVADPSKELELVLSRDAVVRGLVTRRADGRGVGGVTVRTIRHDGRDSSAIGKGTTTDAEGRFVRRLDPGSYSFFARGEGLVSAAFLSGEEAARAAGQVELRAGHAVEITIETVPGARIVGTVRDVDGKPVAGATVLAHRRIRGGAHKTGEAPWDAYGSDWVEAGQEGTFELPSLVGGIEYLLTATAWGRPGSPDRRVRADASVPAHVDLVIPSARWVEVTVLDAQTSAPVADAKVHAFTSGGDPGEAEVGTESRSEADARTDEQGRARLGPMGPGEIVFSAYATGFADDNTMKPSPLAEGPHGLSTTLRIERARRIGGRVLRPDGSPAVGAAVHLTTLAGSGTMHETKGDGTFEFDHLGDDDRRIRATLEAEGLASETITAPLGSTDLTLRLSMRGLIVRVLDPEGNPVPSASASYGYLFPSGRGSSSLRRPVKEGRLVFDLDEDEPPTEGTLEVEEAADDAGLRLPLGSVRIEHVRPGAEVVVRLPPERVIEGRVLGPDGRGVVGAKVRVECLDRGESALRESLEAPWTWTVSRFVATDASGSFRVGQLRDGAYLVAVLPPPPYAPPETLRRDADTRDVAFTLRLAKSATIAVVGPDGRAVAGAKVVAVRRAGQRRQLDQLFTRYVSGWSATGETAADGRARLEGFDPAETFVLGVRAPASANLADDVLDAWSPSDATVRLAAGLSVAGFARDEKGAAIVGATVECVDARGASRGTTTGEGGAFRFVGLAAGRLRLEARSYSGPRQRDRVDAEATVEAGTEGVVLELR